MNSRFHSWILILLMIALGPAVGRAQSAYDVRHIGVREGLPDALPQDVVSDNKGRLWIGTESGLCLQEGHDRMTTLTRENSGLTNNTLRAVCHDTATDRLLVGMMKGGLCVVDCQSLEVTTLPGSEGDVTRITKATDGGAWVVYYKGIVRHYDFHTGELQTLLLRERFGLESTLRSCVDDGQGNLFIGCNDGVYSFRLADSVLTRRANGHKLKMATALWVDQMKNLWIGTSEGLYLLNTRTEELTPFRRNSNSEPPVIDGNVRAFYGAPDGRLWVGADPGGICIIDINEYYGNGGKRLPRHWLNAKNSLLAANSINRLGGDAQGHVFVSMVNVGCDILTPSRLPFTMLTTSSFTIPTADGDGLLWAGGTGSILLQADGQEWKMEQGQFDVIAMQTDSQGRLWLVSNYQGVQYFEPQAEQFHLVGIKGYYINCAYNDADDTILIGTENGLYNISKNSEGQFAVSHDTLYHPQMSNHAIQSICRDRLGQLWLSTKSEGVYVFGSDGHKTAYLHEGAGLPSDFAVQVISDHDGRLWIGTAEGLVAVADPGKPTETLTIGMAQGLANAHIQAIAEDNKGRIWCSTFTGISCYDPERQQCYNFNASAGVPDGMLQSAVTRLAEGSICFGSKKGICTFQPDAALAWLEEQATDIGDNGKTSGRHIYWLVAVALTLIITTALLFYRKKKTDSLQAVNPEGQGVAATENQPATITALDQEFLDRLRGLIEQNLSTERVDMDFLTAQMGMSQSALYRKVKVLTGLTTNEFIRKIRMTTAARLLKEGHNASETAYLTGFNSQNLFRKYFKEEFGMLPSEYIHAFT